MLRGEIVSVSQIVENAGSAYCGRTVWRGMEEQAVEQLRRAVELEPTYRHRGNLDPEIASLINKYDLFEEEEY